jgi:hypothetical protein
MAGVQGEVLFGGGKHVCGGNITGRGEYKLALISGILSEAKQKMPSM